MSLKKKKYVVTGALKDGIGQAVTKRLLAENCDVIGTYAPELADRAKNPGWPFSDAKLVLLDADKKPSWQALVKSVGDKIDGLVNVEMLFAMENPEHFDYDAWDKSLSANLTLPNFLAHELKGVMVDGASIVTITSSEGFIGSFGASAYAATKAAIHNLTKTLANNFGSRAIRVNAIAPGWIGGVMDTDEVFNMSRKITPLGRLGSPDEVANVVWFLLSDQSSFVNGTTILVDGGYSGVDTIAKYEFEQSQKTG